jgi:hypothetical protein
VEILSTDNQNLAHTVLTVTFPKQTDITVHNPYDPAGGTDANPCARSDGLVNIVFTCDYGSLTPALPERTIAFVMDVASTFNTVTQAARFVSAQVTTNNENGTNQQTFPASSGSFQVQARNPNHLASWVPSGQSNASFSTAALGSQDAGNFSSTIAFDTSSNEAVALTEGTTTAYYPCPTGLACALPTEYTEATTTSGSFAGSPYFRWTLRALVPKTYTFSQGFVAHYLSQTDTDPDILYFKDKSAYCGSDTAAKIAAANWCIFSAALSKPVGGFSTLTLILLMNHQGGMKI